GTCGGLHGHVRVSPDGTGYVPNESCFDANSVNRPGVAVSTDNGLSWVVRTVPDGESISPGTDPSVAEGANNTIYLGYVNSDGHAKIAVSADRGLHWSKSEDAGTPFGVQNTEFAEVIVGYANGCTGRCVTDPTQNASTGAASAQDALATIARQVGGLGLFKSLDGTQFATRTGDIKGHAKLCFGSPAKGVRGDPGCKA